MISETVYIDMETDLVFKVLSGTATTLELQQIEEWKNAHLKNAAEFDALQMYWNKNNLPGADENESRVDQGLRALKKEIAEKVRTQRRRNVITWAAIVILSGIGIIYLGDFLIRKSYERTVLKFDDVKIAEVITTMEREYNVTIELPAPLEECVFSGDIFNTSLQSSLAWISVSMGWKVIKTGDHNYRIEGVGCGKTNNTVQLK